jgi:hypothetical protein
MLHLVFGEHPTGSLTVGPLPEFCFDRNAIRESRGAAPLAEHRDHRWIVGGARYLRVDCEAPIKLHFEHDDGSASKAFGPYRHLSAVNGTIYADREVFATYHEGTRVWCWGPDASGWPQVVVRGLPASDSGAT